MEVKRRPCWNVRWVRGILGRRSRIILLNSLPRWLNIYIDTIVLVTSRWRSTLTLINWDRRFHLKPQCVQTLVSGFSSNTPANSNVHLINQGESWGLTEAPQWVCDLSSSKDQFHRLIRKIIPEKAKPACNARNVYFCLQLVCEPKGGKMRRMESVLWSAEVGMQKYVWGWWRGGLNKVPADPTGDTVSPDVTAGNRNGGAKGTGTRTPLQKATTGKPCHLCGPLTHRHVEGGGRLPCWG